MINLNTSVGALKLIWIKCLSQSDCKWQYFIKSEIDMENGLHAGLSLLKKTYCVRYKTNFGKTVAVFPKY